MTEEIKNLRVKIDGLAQLVRDLKPRRKYIIDLAYIPKSHGMDLEKFMHLIDTRGYAIINSKENGDEKTSSFGPVIPLLSEDEEIRKAYDSLILAKAWLGKMLEFIGADSPYQNDGKRKTVEDIESTADTSTVLKEINKFPEITNTINGFNWMESTHIEKVDWLREEIKKLTTYLWNLDLDNIELFDLLMSDSNVRMTKIKAQEYLIEARFWLGFELQRIKESNEIS